MLSDDSPVPAVRRFPRRGRILLAAAIMVVGGVGTAWYFSAWRNLLFYGIKAEKLGLVRLMLQVGADPNGVLKFDTPLTTTVYDLEHPLAMTHLLLEFRADPNLQGSNGHRPLQSLRHWKNAECCTENPDAALVVGALLKAGADIRACGGDRSLLEIPSSVEFAKLLLSRGADPNQICSSHCGETALRSVLKYPELVELYLEHGAKILPDPCSNLTLLHRVASFGVTEAHPHP
jgi:ankyrin repeat protein